MKAKIFKSKYENKLFSLYCALDSYFRPSRCQSFHSVGDILPFLFQAASKFWCSSDYDKIVDYDLAFDHVLALSSKSPRSRIYVLYIKRGFDGFGQRYFYSYENMRVYMDNNPLSDDFYYDYIVENFTDFEAPYTK